MGLLYNIGRREEIIDMKHIICGYRFMKSNGYVDISRICLNHSFPYKDIRVYNGKNDRTEKETGFIEKYLAETKYDDYDRLDVCRLKVTQQNCKFNRSDPLVTYTLRLT